MALIRSQVQILLEENLPRVLALLILSYLEDKEVCVRAWGKKGNGPGEFAWPNGIVAIPFNFSEESKSTGEVIVVDMDNHRVQVFSLQGEFVRMWGAEHGRSGDGPGEFNRPRAAAVLPFSSSREELKGSSSSSGEELKESSPSYEIFIVDTNNHRVQVFNSEGDFLRMWGIYGNEPEKFVYPSGIALSPSKEVIITDTWNGRTRFFTPEGKLLRIWEKRERVESPLLYNITLLSPGKVVIADTNNHRIQVLDLGGELLRVWGKAGEGKGEFIYPHGITSLPSGEIIVADTDNHRVQVFSPEGQFLRMWGKKGKEPGEFAFPYGISAVCSSSREIFVADTWNHRIQVFHMLLD